MSGSPPPPATLEVFLDAPPEFEPRAAWVLETLLAPLGRRVAVVRDPAQAKGTALAYAPAPVAGVPTIPCSAEALDLFAATKPLPAGAFARRPRTGTGRAAEDTG
ncbi:MAG: hypothetical protein IH629_01865, partial [Thermoleophilia bacterium]|nr:hypothetical protein [Thermoleophilia bacterium]